MKKKLRKKKSWEEIEERILFKIIWIIRLRIPETNLKEKDHILKMMKRLNFTCNLEENMEYFKE